MKVQPVYVERHGRMTWENPTLEAIRKEECMCWGCGRMKTGQPEHCPIAAAFFALCVEHEAATPISRCAEWIPKG